MRKTMMSTVLLGASLGMHAQSPAPSSGHTWASVQALAPNTSLHISARTHNAHCRLKSVDADTLTCAAGAKTETYQRTDIKSIKVPHLGRSIAAGLGIGAAGGFIGGAASGGSGQLFTRTELGSAFGAIFGGIGAIIGALTDFTQSTVYRA